MKRAVLRLSLLGVLCLDLPGHVLVPTVLNLRLGGFPGTFTLSTGGGETDCTTTIGITVSGSAVTVDPMITQFTTPPDTQATFTVTPVKVGTAIITVKWIAGTSPSCNGEGSPTIAVTVADIPTPPAGTQEKEVIEPVSMANGAEINSWLDLRLRGPLPLYFERFYYSALQSEGQVNSALGPNWMHNYDLRLAATATSASVAYTRGQTIRFANSGGTWSQTTPDALAYQLVQSGTTYRMLDPGNKRVYTFDGATGQLQSIQDRNGNTNTLTYANGLLARVSDGAGGTLDFTYNAANNLTAVTDQSGRALAFSYIGGALAGSTDGGGKNTTYRYSGAALLTAVVPPRGNTPYTQNYDSTGKVISALDAAGNRYTFTYDAASGQSAMTDPLAQVTKFTHNKRTLTQQTDPAGNVTTFTYDANSRLTAKREPNGSTTGWTYASGGLIATTNYPDGTRAAFTYTPMQLNGFTYYDLTSITYGDGATESFQYDAKGNVIARTARNGQQWSATYNSLGQPLTMSAPNGGKIVIAYSQDGASTPVSIQFPATDVVTIRTDKLKRMTARVRSDGATVSYTYDGYDNVLTRTDENGAVTAYAYDANGFLSSITDPLGGVIKYTRTGTDQLATATDAAGRAVTVRYDALDRVSAYAFADGSSSQAGYDAAGNLVALTDGEGKVWGQSYDSAGNLTSVANPAGGRTSYTLDAAGRILTATTPAGKKVAFAYDAMGRVTSVTDPASNATKLAYDKAGAPTSLTLPGDISAQYTRDALEHVTAVTDPNGNQWKFSYDAAGRILSFTDPLGGVSTFQRDGVGHITGQTTSMGTLALTLDAAGRPLHAQYSDGAALDFTRDKRGRLLSTAGASFQYDASGLLSASNGLQIARDSLTRVTQVTLAPGKTIQYTYDRRGLCTQVKDWNGGVTTLQYDDASRLISIARPNSVTTTYTYDADSDIAAIKEAAAATLSTITLTRDARGLVSKADRNVPAAPTAAQLAAAQSLHTFNAASQIADFRYDANGRRLADETRSYTWDLAGHLTGYQAVDGTSSVFTYDGTGLLASQTIGGVTRQFVWNHALYIPSVSVVRSGAADLLYLVHSPDGQLLYSVDADGKRRFYHYDEQGNTNFVTDAAGAVADKFSYTEYGALLSPPSSSDLFLFGGRYGAMHLGAGLYSLRQRVYDSTTAAFLSPDPKTHLAPNLISPYNFANGNPLLFTDVTGADPGATGSAPVSNTATNVVTGAGAAAGTTATHLESAANATQEILEMVDFSAEGVKGTQAGIRATKTITKYRNIAKPLGTVSKVGSAAKVLSVGINTYNLHEGIHQSESEDDQNRAGAELAYQAAFKSIGELYAAGKITAIQRNNLRLAATLNHDEALFNLDQQLLDNLLYHGFTFFTESMQEVPFVNDAAIAIGNQFYK